MIAANKLDYWTVEVFTQIQYYNDLLIWIWGLRIWNSKKNNLKGIMYLLSF